MPVAKKDQPMDGDAFLSAVESGSIPDTVELVDQLSELVRDANKVRSLLALVRGKLVAIQPALQFIPDVDVDAVNKALSDSESLVTVQLKESGSTKTARATSAVTSSTAGAIIASGGSLSKVLTRSVKADHAASYNSARWAILDQLAPDKNDPQRDQLASILDAWISDDTAKAEPIQLGDTGVQVMFVG